MKKRVTLTIVRNEEAHIELNEGGRTLCTLRLTMEEADSLFSELGSMLPARRQWQQYVMPPSNQERIKGRLPIRYAVIKLGYEILGAANTEEEAIAEAEKREPKVRSLILPNEEERADGEVFIASIENDYFDDYFIPNQFESIGGNWYAI